MPKPNTNAQKTQIIEVLQQDYFPMIPQLQQNWTAQQHEKNRLSRSLAAFAIANLANVTPTQAAHSIINGENDNGIDAVYFDRIKNFLWLVQAKAGKAPDMGDNKKFCDGIRDLVHRRFQKFNEGFSRLQQDVEDALDANTLKIVGCNVYLDGSLGSHVVNDLNQLKEELNQFAERFEWRNLNISQTYTWLTAKQAIAPVDVSLTLENWHCLDQPRKAFYGLVKASELASLYQQHDKSLFEKNIRYYLGTEDVNSAIAATVANQPAELFYLNNGLTITCSSIALPSGHNQKSTLFSLKGFSVVNGAQTVGAIASAYSINGSISPDAKLLVTIIEVGTAADSIGLEITKARNTQNTVRDVYFAALDPNQERLRQECMISNIVYQYRPSADSQDAITIEQAAIALACFSGNTEIVVTAKREISRLYKREYHYSTLFSEQLSGVTLCRYVRIFQYLDQIFAASEKAETENRRKMFYKHGRFFILDILSRRYKPLLDKPEVAISQDDQTELSRITLELAELIYTIAESLFGNNQKGYLAIFKSLTDVVPLTSAVMQELARRDTQERLRKECMELNINYHYVPLAVQDNQNKITLEQAVIVLACFVGNTEILVTVNRESGNFYKRPDKMLFNNMIYYDILFNNSVSGIKLCRYVNMFQYLDQIFTTSEQDVQEIRRKYFYQYGKFFILYILSKRHKVLFDKPEIAMSQEDKAELSQIGLELAEFIYNVAESLFRNVYKEYRDIFNNLNDIENLDRVIQELERGDAPAANPNIPTA